MFMAFFLNNRMFYLPASLDTSEINSAWHTRQLMTIFPVLLKLGFAYSATFCGAVFSSRYMCLFLIFLNKKINTFTTAIIPTTFSEKSFRNAILIKSSENNCL
jgi:hypothetical protein